MTIDAVMRLMRDNAHRRFRIDIEVDSTIAGEELEERQDRMLLASTMTASMEKLGPMVQAMPQVIDFAGDLMKFTIRGFRTGRTLEASLEEMLDKLEQQLGQPQPPPQPSPDELVKAQVAQAKGQAEIMKAQIDAQTARIEAAAKVQQAQMDERAAMAEHQRSMQQGQQEMALGQQQARNDAASQQMKAQVEIARFNRAIDAQNAPPKPPGGNTP